MAIAIGARKISIGNLVAGIGALVAVVGAFLPWETMKEEFAALAGQSSTISGFSSGNAGKLVTVFGIIVLVVVVAAVMEIKLPVRQTLIGGAAVLLLVALWGFLGINKDVSDANAIVPGIGAVGMGLYISLLGGVVAVVGGVLDMMKKDA